MQTTDHMRAEMHKSSTPPAHYPRLRDHGERAPHALAGLTIVLPAFNEEPNIAEAIRNATAAGERCAKTHEIIVVDDGSRDATAAVAASYAARDSRVRLVLHSGNQGYGQAVRSGIAAARMPWVLLTDADLQFDLRQLEHFLPFTSDSDLIVGHRVLRSDRLTRRLNAAAWNWLVRALFHLPVSDVDCAFKLVRRDVLARVELSSTGAMISTELVVRLLAAGARLEEQEVRHLPRVAGEETGGNPRVIARAFRELAGLRRTLPRLPITASSA
jgi:glycosyltransferase involved in cell wall biosynthesis